MVLFAPALFSQPWLKNLPQDKLKKELTLYDYRKAFDEYWAPFKVDKGYYMENGVKKKAAGWKQFKRWEYNMEGQINPATGAFPEKTAEQVYEEYLQKNPDIKSPASLTANWVSKGPIVSDGGYSGIGRLNCIAFHPSNNSMYWVGAASGGLWVTTNNASSWICLTDNNGVLAVSDIVIPTDFATSNTIYIATGDKDHWDNRSIGVLKSTNGGTTWNTTGITFALVDNKMVYRLLLDPGNNQTLIAATSNGVYKTTNGGTTWSTLLTSTVFIDMEYKPGDFNTLYGSTTGGEIWYSSNGGGNWTRAFYDASAKRIELGVSANQPTWVYALAAAANNGLYAIYKSTTSGTSYSQVFAGTTLNLLGWNSDGMDSGGQGWYDLSLAVVPTNANILLVGGVNTWRSTTGGTSWSIVNHWWGDGVPAAHADKHNLVFRSNGDLFECNDGGVYLSSNNGTSWTDKSNGIVSSQMYKLGVSQTVSNETVTGLQDNGTKLYTSGFWYDIIGGDGMECLIDFDNNNIQYGSYVYGEIYRTTDHWTTSTMIQPPSSGDGAWVTPYMIDPTAPIVLYAGYTNMWKTTDRGNTWTQLGTLSTSDKIRSMAIAPSYALKMYVASTNTIWMTQDGGTVWTNITGTLPVGSGNITSIAVQNNASGTVWVTLGGYNSTTVYQSTNSGTTWTNISTGLPSLPAYSIVQNKQSTSEVQLYVGTELGVYFKKGSSNWVPFNTGLPNLKIGELDIYYAASSQNSKLRAATYGRGLWETSVYYPDPPVGGTATSNSPICTGTPATLTLTGSTGSIYWQQSPTGSGSWTYVSGGSGATTTTYISGNLTTTTYYRAELSVTGYSAAYSTTATVIVNSCAGFAINGAFLYNNTGNTPLDLMWVRLKSNGTIVDSAQANASGQYSFANKANGTYTISGRCTKPWGGVNGTDALKIQQHFVGIEVLTEPVRILAADANLSNSINGTDAIKVKMRFVGLESSFVRGDWAFAIPVTGGETVIVNGSNVTQNFYGLCVGDVNGSNTPSAGKSAQNPVSLTNDGSVDVTPGQILDIPMRIVNTGQFGAVSLVLTYPGELITVENVTMTRPGLIYNINRNQVRLAWSDPEPLDLVNGDELLTLRIRVSKDFKDGMTAEFSLTDESELADGWGNPVPDAALSTLKLRSAANNGITGNISVFPNPAGHEVNIEYELGKAAEISVELASVQGQTLKRLTFSHAGQGKYLDKIDLSGFANGVYLLKIRTGEETGGETTVKLVVSR